MRTFIWRTAALVALTSAAPSAFAEAQQSTSDGQAQSGSSSSSSKDQKQATKNDNSTNDKNNSANNSQSGSAQRSQDSKNSQSSANQKKDQQNSQNRSNQNQSNQNRDDRSSPNSASDGTASSKTRDRDDRSNTRDRDDKRNGDNRSSNTDRESSREHSSQRGNLRGPDIGIWFSRSSRDGLVISDVSTRGPIAKLGFREGDRIVSINGQRVTREDEFIQYLVRSDARRVKVIVLRDNREETIYVEPAVLVDDHDYAEVDPLERFGIVLDDRYDDRIVVWRIIPRSPAYYAGFRPGDVIVTFSGRPYRTRTEFETGSRTWKTGDANVQIRRGDRTRELSVEIPNADRADKRQADRSNRKNEQSDAANSTTADQNSNDRGSTEKSNRKSNDTQPNNNRGGILNGTGLGRGNR